MATVFYVPNNEQLKRLVEDLNKVTDAEIHSRDVVCLMVQKEAAADLLGKILDASGLQFDRFEETVQADQKKKEPDPGLREGEQKAKAAKKNGKEPRHCEFCGELVGPRAKICSADECKKKQQAKYNAAYQASKKGNNGNGSHPAPFVMSGHPPSQGEGEDLHDTDPSEDGA